MKLAEAVEFAENPEPRCPCVLLLDVSGSMSGAPIEALNAGLQTFREELNRDELARKRVEIAIATFADRVQVVQDFVTPDEFEPPVLTAGGLTCLGSALETGLQLIGDRKASYRTHGISYYRPWLFAITDGEPQGEPEAVVERAAQQIQTAEAERRLACFAVGVEGANLARLSDLTVRTPLKLKGLCFRELFVWLSASMQSVSHSQVGDQVPLQAPTGWAEV